MSESWMNCAPGMCYASYSLRSPTWRSARESSFTCSPSHSVETINDSFTFPESFDCACTQGVDPKVSRYITIEQIQVRFIKPPDSRAMWQPTISRFLPTIYLQ